MLTECARAARTGRLGVERHQTADRATLADVYGRDHRAPLRFTAGKLALLTFQPMYTNYGHLNRSYGRTICSHGAGNVRHLFWPQANCQCKIPRVAGFKVAGCIKLQNGLVIQFGNGWYNMWRMTVLVAERKFSLSLGTFSNHLIMKQTEITTNILLFFWFFSLTSVKQAKGWNTSSCEPLDTGTVYVNAIASTSTAKAQDRSNCEYEISLLPLSKSQYSLELQLAVTTSTKRLERRKRRKQEVTSTLAVEQQRFASPTSLMWSH